jgi:O-antigen ligase
VKSHPTVSSSPRFLRLARRPARADRWWQAAGFAGACWPSVALAVLLVTLPIHAAAARVGFALKPWFLPLLALGLLRRRHMGALARTLPGWLAAGLAFTLVGAVVGLASGGAPVTAGRHLLALLLVTLLVLVMIDGLAHDRLVALSLRVAGFAMAGAATLEALAAVSSQASGFLMTGVPPVLQPLASVEYGVVLVARGLHHDSNFSALYAAAWIFLVLIFPLPAERRAAAVTGSTKGPPSRWDSALVGLLVVQAAVAFSRSGALALLVASLVYLWLRRLERARRSRARRRLSAGTVVGVVVAVFAVLVPADYSDGVGHLAAAAGRRASQLGEGQQIVTELAREPTEPRAAPVTSGRRADIWRAYLGSLRADPMTGIGFGVGVRAYGSYAHNALLESAVGGGILALAGSIMLWVGAFMALWRRWSGDPDVPAVAGLLVATVISSLLLTTNFDPLTGLVFALASGVCGLGTRRPVPSSTASCYSRSTDGGP